jgi:hypothetical protein
MNTKHVCAESESCCCSLTALEPDEDCPIHGNPWPPTCGACGRFVKRELATLKTQAEKTQGARE